MRVRLSDVEKQVLTWHDIRISMLTELWRKKMNGLIQQK